MLDVIHRRIRQKTVATKSLCHHCYMLGIICFTIEIFVRKIFNRCFLLRNRKNRSAPLSQKYLRRACL
jgi:hypothetical protein